MGNKIHMESLNFIERFIYFLFSSLKFVFANVLIFKLIFLFSFSMVNKYSLIYPHIHKHINKFNMLTIFNIIIIIIMDRVVLFFLMKKIFFIFILRFWSDYNKRLMVSLLYSVVKSAKSFSFIK